VKEKVINESRLVKVDCKKKYRHVLAFLVGNIKNFKNLRNTCKNEHCTLTYIFRLNLNKKEIFYKYKFLTKYTKLMTYNMMDHTMSVSSFKAELLAIKIFHKS